MKPVLIFFHLLIVVDGLGQSLHEVRTLYEQSFDHTEANDKIHEMLKEDWQDMSPEFGGYFAVSYFMKSKDGINPFKKLEHFSHGKDIMNQVIAQHPKNLELRFLRYTIQKMIPKFLNYDDQLFEDRELIETLRIVEKDNELKSMIDRHLSTLESKNIEKN